jgi:hypothetical protein
MEKTKETERPKRAKALFLMDVMDSMIRTARGAKIRRFCSLKPMAVNAINPKHEFLRIIVVRASMPFPMQFITRRIKPNARKTEGTSTYRGVQAK